jgi:hypothetical protein
VQYNLTVGQKIGIGTKNPLQELNVVGDVNITNNLIIEKNLTLGERIIFNFGETIDNLVDGWMRVVGNLIVDGDLNISKNLNIVGNITGGNLEVSNLNVTGNLNVPNQPSFLVYGPGQIDFAKDIDVTVIWNTEVFDVGNNFASNTFTAPITGKYQFNVILRFQTSIDTAASFYYTSLITSNRNYDSIVDPKFSSDTNYFTQTISTIADMDAGDTAYVIIFQSGGTQQTDIGGGVSVSSFSGALLH